MKNLKHLCLTPLLTLPLNLYAAEPIKISGIMEIDASYSKDYNQNSRSDITVSKIELAFDTNINVETVAHVLILHEDDSTEPLQLDEATLTMQLGGGWYLNGGRMVVPFGIYETHFVADPITAGLGEASETALQIGFERDGLYGSFYAFNGDTINTSSALKGNDRTQHFGGNLGYIITHGDASLNLGVDYINNLADADAVSGMLSINTDTDGDTIADKSTLNRYVKGVSLHAVYNDGPWTAIAEHMKAGRFEATELAFNGNGAAPSATNVEVAYSFSWGTVATAYQTTREALSLALPKQRTLIGFSMRLLENSTLNIELSKDKDYSDTVGGTGAKGTASTIQLAVAF